MDPAALLRPISTAAKAATAPVLQNARDHSHFQHLLVQQLAPIVRGLEEPLRIMRTASPYLDKASVEQLSTVARELTRLTDSMAPPAWWKRLVFWKLADTRPVLERFVSDLLKSASTAESAHWQFKQWKDSKPHPQYFGELSPEKLEEAQRFWARTEELQKLERELNTKLDASRASRAVADEFFHAWLRGGGFINKPKRSKK